jgi:23S rRNA (pseudouridine1915-N3)-methyltransferase
MMRVIAIGRSRDGPEAELFARYSARTRPTLELTELADGKGAQAEIKRREGQALLAALPAQAFTIALDLDGEMLDSTTFAARLEGWLGLSRPLCFLIGGAEGLDQPVIARAEFTLSLGRLTWPHLLVRAMLAEQIYRARSISAGHPYHRSGRPER